MPPNHQNGKTKRMSISVRVFVELRGKDILLAPYEVILCLPQLSRIMQATMFGKKEKKKKKKKKDIPCSRSSVS